MRATQRFLGVLIVLIMLLASMGNAAMAQDQGNQTGTSTQGGGGNVLPPSNNNPDPAPAPDPEPEPSNPPAPNPQPRPQPSNGAQGGSQSGTSDSSGTQAPEGLAPRPQPQSPPSGGSGGSGGGSGTVTITVDLSEQRIYVYRGGELSRSTLVRTGKPGFETPTGTWYINNKYRFDDMAGNERNESWYVEDVPYAMYFTGVGHALHGVTWSNDWGTPGSHGCVGMPVDFAGWLYGIAPSGTKVTIRW